MAHHTCQHWLLEMGMGKNTGETYTCAAGEIVTAKLPRQGTSLFDVSNNLSVTIADN